jgi:hypothetical protein
MATYPVSTLITQPTNLNPTAAEIWFQWTCAGATFSNFNYWVQLNTLVQGTASQIVQTAFPLQSFPPEPNLNGLTTVNEYLNTQVSNILNPLIEEMLVDTGSVVRYNLTYGLSFNPQLPFTDVTNSTGALTLTANTSVGGGNFIIAPNDIITIEMTNTLFNPQYNGTSSVTGSGSTYIITNTAFGTTSSIPQPGLITGISRICGTTSDFWAYNGTRQYDQINTDFTQLQIGGVATQWLTDFSTTISGLNDTWVYKPIFLNQYETSALFMDPTSVLKVTGLEIVTYDQTFTQIATYSIVGLTSSVGYEKYEFGVGTQNLADAGIPFTGVYYYVVLPLINFGLIGFELSGILRKIVQCNPSPYTNVQLAWLNTFGDWDYYNFNYKNVYTQNITRTTIGNILPWNYNVGDRGTDNLSIDGTKSGSISTGFITETDAAVLANLHRALEVYKIVGTYSYPIQLSDPTFTYKTYLNEKLIEVDFTYTDSFPINIQFN